MKKLRIYFNYGGLEILVEIMIIKSFHFIFT